MAGNKMPNDLGLERHFKQLLKEYRELQQKKHGERVEARQKEKEPQTDKRLYGKYTNLMGGMCL